MDSKAPETPVEAASDSHASALDADTINSTAPVALTSSATSPVSESPLRSGELTTVDSTCTGPLSPTSPSTVPVSTQTHTQTQPHAPGLPEVQPARTERPSWATGDPFFDTMAGMDSSEYRQYHTGLTQDQQHIGEEAPEDRTATVDGSSTTTDTSIGLDHWNRTREQWTMGRWQAVPSANSNNPALGTIHAGNYEAIYRNLILDRRRLSKPIPLPLVIKVLVSGWKQDGTWPDAPTQQLPSAMESAPLSTASSAPLQEIDTIVPGFSSPQSQPVQRTL